jgi:aryl-alcohol dehydrogenase-like predicted oxidoreductase
MSDEKIGRRRVIRALGGAGVAAAAGGALLSCRTGARSDGPPGPSPSSPAPLGEPAIHAGGTSDMRRVLGKTGIEVDAVSLGGEGVLRTTGRSADAVPVILEALRLGVRYCDMAPAYQQSQDYYGEALRAAGKGAREKLTLASKTHARDRDGALRLLDDSLRRLGTSHLDIWQLHDLRETEDLTEIFGKGGAIEAVEKAKADGRVRFVGITGHHDPAILVEAMRRYPFDTVLCAMNPADPRRMPFLQTVVPEARRRGMGIIGMKVMAAGRLLRDRAATPEELIQYAASFADTVIIGCSSIAEVQENLEAGRRAAPMETDARLALERRIAKDAARYDSFKAG